MSIKLICYPILELKCPLKWVFFLKAAQTKPENKSKVCIESKIQSGKCKQLGQPPPPFWFFFVFFWWPTLALLFFGADTFTEFRQSLKLLLLCSPRGGCVRKSRTPYNWLKENNHLNWLFNSSNKESWCIEYNKEKNCYFGVPCWKKSWERDK